LKFGALPKVLSLWYGQQETKVKILENIVNSIKMYDLNILLKEKEKWKLEEVLQLLAEKNTTVIKFDKLVQELWIKRQQIQNIVEAINQVWLILF
jgi:predicted AAA+ superfamily ATPase